MKENKLETIQTYLKIVLFVVYGIQKRENIILVSLMLLGH